MNKMAILIKGKVNEAKRKVIHKLGGYDEFDMHIALNEPKPAIVTSLDLQPLRYQLNISDEDTIVLAFAFDADLVGVQTVRKNLEDVFALFEGLDEALEVAGENLCQAIAAVRSALSEAGDGHV